MYDGDFIYIIKQKERCLYSKAQYWTWDL